MFSPSMWWRARSSTISSTTSRPAFWKMVLSPWRSTMRLLSSSLLRRLFFPKALIILLQTLVLPILLASPSMAFPSVALSLATTVTSRQSLWSSRTNASRLFSPWSGMTHPWTWTCRPLLFNEWSLQKPQKICRYPQMAMDQVEAKKVQSQMLHRLWWYYLDSKYSCWYCLVPWTR